MMYALPRTLNATPADESLHTLWRTKDSTILTLLIDDERVLGELCTTVACVRPMARVVARTPDQAEPAALAGAVVTTDRGGGRVQDCLATDLLASALLVEAVEGDPGARRCIDHMRRQRRLPAIAWSLASPRRTSDADDAVLLSTF